MTRFFGKVGFVQIDTGRIGGIGPAKAVADRAVARGVTFVNHTFTSHLALSASIQPYAGLADHRIAEYPFAPRQLVSPICGRALSARLTMISAAVCPVMAQCSLFCTAAKKVLVVSASAL